MLTQSQHARNYLVAQVERRLLKRGRPAVDRSDIRDTVERLFVTGDIFAKFRALGTEYDGSQQAKWALSDARSKLFNRFTSSLTVLPSGPGGRPCRYESALNIDEQARLENKVIKEMLWIYVIKHPRMATHQAGQKRLVDGLLKQHLRIAAEPHPDELDLFPVDTRESLEKLRGKKDRDAKIEFLRLVVDHVAGMTDSYAQRLHSRIRGFTEEFNVFI